MSEFIEKYEDRDLFLELRRFVQQRLMKIEAEQQIGAGKHERGDERNTHSNGYRDQRLETRLGTMNLKIPKLRIGTYFPSSLEPRKISQRALVAVAQEECVKGIGTRKASKLVQGSGKGLFR